MILKNINKYLLFFFLIFLYSCKSIEILNHDKKNNFIYNDIFEFESTIDYKNNDLPIKYFDYYNLKKSYNFQITAKKIKKIHTFNSYKKKHTDSKSIHVYFLSDNQVLSLDSKSNLNFFNFDDFKLINSIKIQYDNNNDHYPTSTALFNKNIYIGYSDGQIICVNFLGEIKWSKKYNDILKTPIKIHNDNLILLLSDRIISLDVNNGNENWNYFYANNNVLQSNGGYISSLNELLFFILPNNEIGLIDSIIGEKYHSALKDIEIINNINNSTDSIHSYENYISYFDEKKYLSTIDVNSNAIILNRNIFENVKSYKFFNNTNFALLNDGFLKAININNGKIFWQINLSKFFYDDIEIINISSNRKSIFIFFNNGNIIELNPLNGNLFNIFDINLNDINEIYFFKDFLFVNQYNGKTSIFQK